MSILQIDKDSDEESRKLFKFIDYSNSGEITRDQIKLFLTFAENEYGKSG